MERFDIREKLADRYEAGEIVTCVPVILEAMHRSETSARHRQQFDELLPHWSVVFRQGLEVICEHTGQPGEPEESTGAGH
jgi:hypothetical protein